MIAASAPQRAAQPLSDDIASALDPVMFARKAGIEPDAWQAGVLRSQGHRLLMNCSRQSGKSTVAAVVGLHQAIFRPGSLVLLLSPSLRQSGELFRTVSQLYTATGATVPAKAETALRLELENGSRILSLPASEATIRGYSGVALLVIDEASRVEDSLYASVRPMLATTNGKLIALSTPFGKRGWWSAAWHDGGSVWQRVMVTADECPRISRAFLAEERESLGEWWYTQEYLCQFVDADSQAFRSEDVEAASTEWVTPWSL